MFPVSGVKPVGWVYEEREGNIISGFLIWLLPVRGRIFAR